MKRLLAACLLLIVAHPAFALTNGSATLSWQDTNAPATVSAVIVEWRNYTNPVWTSVASFPFGPLAYAHTWTPFPADTLTDHWACWRVSDVIGGVRYTSDTACQQIPVAAPAPTPEPIPDPTPTPEPLPPSNLTVTQLDVDRVQIVGRSGTCAKLRTTGSGLKRIVTCLH